MGRNLSFCEKKNSEMLGQILLLMQEGASINEVCAHIGVHKQTLINYRNPNHKQYQPLLAETIKQGELLSQAWWEKEGRKNLKDRNFSYVGWYMNMKNRFGWRDKIETNEISASDNDTRPSSDLVRRYERDY